MITSAVALSLIAGTLASVDVPFEHSLPCMTRPMSSILAGDRMSFQLIGDNTHSCAMVMSFSDPRFLPIALQAVPRNCSGNQQASFRVPDSVGDGYASIQWQCAGQAATSCDLLSVTGGCNDPEAYIAQRAGTRIQVDCKEPSEVEKKRSETGIKSVLDVLKLEGTSH